MNNVFNVFKTPDCRHFNVIDKIFITNNVRGVFEVVFFFLNAKLVFRISCRLVKMAKYKIRHEPSAGLPTVYKNRIRVILLNDKLL